MQPLQYLPKTLRLSFQEGMKLLQEAGFEVGVDPADSLDTDSHRLCPLSCVMIWLGRTRLPAEGVLHTLIISLRWAVS